MRLLGRRVALLIAGALPLMAEHDASVPPTLVVAETVAARQQREDTAISSRLSSLSSDDRSHDDQEVFGAAESLHDDSVSQLPRLPLNLLEHGGGGDDYDGPFMRDSPPFDLYDKNSIRRASEEAASHRHKDDGIPNGSLLKEGSPQPTAEAAQEEVTNETSAPEQEVPGENVASTTAKITSSPNATNTSGDSTEEAGTVSNVSADESPESNISTKTSDIEDHKRNNNTAAADDTAMETTEVNSTLETSSTATAATTTSMENETNATTIDEEDEDTVILSERVAVDYASKSAGALILEKSPNFKGTSNLLNGDRDKYAISPCAEKKFVVISLSEDILVKQIQLANYELYSSRVKDFQIQISQTMGNWIDLGMYTATPESGVQSIDLREPAWGRYLKFKIKSHYGDEHYCTLSQIMVHGSTMVQGFHEHLQESEDDDLEMEEEEGEEEGFASKEAVIETNNNTTEVLGTANHTQQDPPEVTDPTAADATNAGTAVPEAAQVGTESAQDAKDSAEDRAGNTDSDSSSASFSETEEGTLPADKDDAADEDDNSTGRQEHGVKSEEDDSAARWQNLIRRKALLGESRKDHNSSDVLPAASIGLSSSDVFSTIIGRLEPIGFHGLHGLTSLSNSQQLSEILAKASDSTKKIRKVFTDPAILEHLQLSSLDTIGRRKTNAFGSKEEKTMDEALAEKLNAYIRGNDNDRIKAMARSDATSSLDSSAEMSVTDAAKSIRDPEPASVDKKAEITAAESLDASDDEMKNGDSASYEKLHESDLALIKLLDKLPSVECLKTLDFKDFKKKALAAKKGAHGNKGHPGKENEAAGHAAEPIFKMLTDQIKSLQQSLSVHDQFTKEAVRCYQSVLLDVVVELETMRQDHDARLTRLETDLQETKTVRWAFLLYQLVVGLPNWASLVMATFFTSFGTPAIISAPLSALQSFLEKFATESEHFLLSWTFTVCTMLIFIVVTGALIQRLLSMIKVTYIKKRNSRRSSSVDQATGTSRGKHQDSKVGRVLIGSDDESQQSSEIKRASHQTPSNPVSLYLEETSAKAVQDSVSSPVLSHVTPKDEPNEGPCLRATAHHKESPASPDSVATVNDCPPERKSSTMSDEENGPEFSSIENAMQQHRQHRQTIPVESY